MCYRYPVHGVASLVFPDVWERDYRRRLYNISRTAYAQAIGSGDEFTVLTQYMQPTASASYSEQPDAEFESETMQVAMILLVIASSADYTAPAPQTDLQIKSHVIIVPSL